MDKQKEILQQIDTLYHYFRYSRSFFPYLNPDLIGESSSPSFNISKNIIGQINFNEPITKDFQLINNRIGHYLNQNFLIRLYALLDYHQIVSEQVQIINSLLGSNEIDILRRLRKLFSHTSGQYNPEDKEQKKLAERVINHFELKINYLLSTNCFMNAGQIKIENYEVITLSTNRIGLANFTLKNYSSSLTIEDVVGKLKTSDSRVTEITKSTQSFGAIAAGESKMIPSAFSFYIDTSASLNAIEFELEISSNGSVYCNDFFDITITDVDNDNVLLPDEIALFQNYPNPFNPTTKIKYQIPEQSFVTLKLFDALGNELETLVNEEMPIGTYEITFDASSLPSGIYFYRLQAGTYLQTKKMLLIK